MSRGDIIRISVEGRELEHMPMDHPRGSRSQGGTPSFLGAVPSQSCPHWQLWGRDFEMAFPSGQGFAQVLVSNSHQPQAAAETIMASQSSFSPEIHPRQSQPTGGWHWDWTGKGGKVFKIFNCEVNFQQSIYRHFRHDQVKPTRTHSPLLPGLGAHQLAFHLPC